MLNINSQNELSKIFYGSRVVRWTNSWTNRKDEWNSKENKNHKSHASNHKNEINKKLNYTISSKYVNHLIANKVYQIRTQ